MHVFFCFTQRFHRSDSGRFIFLDANKYFIGQRYLLQITNATHDAIALFLHQSVVTGQVRFTFTAIDDQRVDQIFLTKTQLICRGEHGATHTDNA